MNNPKNKKIQTIWYNSQSYKNYIAQLEAEQRKIDEDRKNKPENFIKRIYNKDSGLITPEVFVAPGWKETWEKANYWESIGSYGSPSPHPPTPPWYVYFGSLLYSESRQFLADIPTSWGQINNYNLGVANDNPATLNYSIILNKKWNFNLSTSASVITVVGLSHGASASQLLSTAMNYKIRKGISPNYKSLYFKGKLTYSFGGSATIYHPSFLEPAGGYNNNIVITIVLDGNKYLVYYDRKTNDAAYFYSPYNWSDIPGVKYHIMKDLTNFDLNIYEDYCNKFGTPSEGIDIYWTQLKISTESQTSIWGSWVGVNTASSNLIAEMDNLWIQYI